MPYPNDEYLDIFATSFNEMLNYLSKLNYDRRESALGGRSRYGFEGTPNSTTPSHKKSDDLKNPSRNDNYT